MARRIFSLISKLESRRAEHAFIGGYALAFNSLVRQTGDVDILVRNSPEDNRKMDLRAFRTPGCGRKGVDARLNAKS